MPVILEAFKFKEACPSIVMAGSKDSQRGKLLAGVARAAFRSDAVILDSGVASGIENYCLRRSKWFLWCIVTYFFSEVNLIGVFPESEISMPKINPT